MSYSFSIIASSKAEAISKVGEKFNTVVANQPSHSSDRDAAINAAKSFIDTLREPEENEKLQVSMSGSQSWTGIGTEEDPRKFYGASCQISAYIAK